MKKICSYLIVLLVIFGFAFTTVNAKNSKKTTKKAEEVTEKEEVTAKEEDKKEVKEEEEKTEAPELKKVNFYLFRLSGCGHCAAEMQFLDSIVPEYRDKLNIIVFEVSSHEGNSKLVNDVATELGKKIGGFPVAVIGDQLIEGYADQISSQFIEAIEKAYNEQTEDIVGKFLEKKYSKLKKETLYDAMDEEGLDYTSKEGVKSNDGLIIAAFFGVIVISLGILIYFSRKK